MSSDVPPPQRRSARLPFYDYSRAGAYFLTICALNRACLFGEIMDGVMVLSAAGHVAEQEWIRSGAMRRELVLDAFVVMPNHVHGIVFLEDTDGKRNDGKDVRTADDDQGMEAGVHRTPLRTQGDNRDHEERAGVHRTPLRIDGGDDRDQTGVHRTPLRIEGNGDREPAAGVHRTPLRRPAGASVGAFVNGYKAAVTRCLLQMRTVSGASAWQRNYYEHIIRNDADLERIRRYIAENPARWSSDQENPANAIDHHP